MKELHGQRLVNTASAKHTHVLSHKVANTHDTHDTHDAHSAQLTECNGQRGCHGGRVEHNVGSIESDGE